MRLKDKIAMVTGSTKGIGMAIARGYASERCHGYRVCRSEDLAKKLSDEITKKGQKVVAMMMDVTSPASINQVVDEVVNMTSIGAKLLFQDWLPIVPAKRALYR